MSLIATKQKRGRNCKEFYNRSMKSWLQDMYSTHNEGKPAVTERFVRILKKNKLQIYNFNIKKCVC